MWLALGMQAHIALRMAMYIAVAVSVFPVQSQQQPHDTPQLPAADIYPRAFWAVQHIRLLTLSFFLLYSIDQYSIIQSANSSYVLIWYFQLKFV